MWFKPYSLAQLNDARNSNLSKHLGIEYSKITENSLSARMPVDERTQQPFGLLHGGASCALAESLGSVCAWMTVDPEKKAVVGIEINANHLRGVKSGFVTGTCTPIHTGKSTQVWNIEIHNEQNQLVCISRLTCAVIDKKS